METDVSRHHGCQLNVPLKPLEHRGSKVPRGFRGPIKPTIVRPSDADEIFKAGTTILSVHIFFCHA